MGTKTNKHEKRMAIEAIAETFRIDQGFTDDANISYISGFDTGSNWQKEQNKETINKLTAFRDEHFSENGSITGHLHQELTDIIKSLK